MKTAAFFVLSAFAILAADPAPETGPNFNEPSRRELPYPLPPDFNECVVVVWNEEWSEKLGHQVGAYEPPLTPEIRASIDKGREKRWGQYAYCSQGTT